QHGRMADHRARPAAVAGVRFVSHRAWVESAGSFRHRALHADRLLRTVFRPRRAVPVPGLARDRPRPALTRAAGRCVMTGLWFGIVSVMLTMFVIMDGYDLGAGVLHLFVARTDDERRRVLAAIGPYWDANVVWLIATGGALFVAFPKVLASGLSGFYLAIF